MIRAVGSFYQQPSFGFSLTPGKVHAGGFSFQSSNNMHPITVRIAVATYRMKMRVFHALHAHMMAATNPSRTMVQMMSFRVSIRISRPALPFQSPPRNLQHFVQYPLNSHISFVVSFLKQCLHSFGSRWASALITLIGVLQSFLPVLVRQCRVDVLLAGFAQHFRIPFLQRHIMPAVEALARCRSHVRPPLPAAEPSDAGSDRPCRMVLPQPHSDIRMILGRFSCRASV